MVIPDTQIHREKDLINRCVQGERVAQYELYGLYSKAMLNTSYRILKDQSLAEDALQDSFLEVFKKIRSFRGESTVGAWIKRIVVNKSINLLNKEKPFEELGGSEEESLLAEEHSDPEFTSEQINTAVLGLPKGFRTVFSLYLLEGYDHKEISEILGVSESTSKSQYKRAKDKVKESLIKMAKDHG